MKQVTIINKVIPAESRSKYGTSGRSSVISGGASVDLSPYLLKAIWERNIEERTDEAGNEYIYIKKPIVGAAGLTFFAGEQLKVDSIFKGLPLDTQTLQWVDGVLTVVGGTGGASNWDELEGKPSWITPEKPKYTWSEIEQKPSWITTEKPKYSYTEITGLVEELKKYVTLSTDQSVTGMKDFANGMKVSGVLFKVINGVLTLDCSIAVTGGITTHAIGEQTTATIMDGIAVDGTTITKENGVLKVVGDIGGASNWDELEGKPSWITDTKPTYAWGEITQKPATLSGYGIQASDVLNTLKTVDGSGSGLDADTLDGFHAMGTSGNVLQKKGYTVAYITPSWCRLAKFGSTGTENNTDTAFFLHSSYSNRYGILIIQFRGGTIINAFFLVSYNIDTTKIRIYYDDAKKNIELYYYAGENYSNIIAELLYSTHRAGQYTNEITMYEADITSPSYANYINPGFYSIQNNASSATKLFTARTIWGQSFDGTANVTGSLTHVTDITGTGTFTGANIKATDSVYVNGIRLHKTADGVITLEGNLAVTGGITQFAVNEVNPSTIMDGVVVDGTSIKKENGVLKVMNAGGGEAGSVKWANITDKPMTLAGYGVSASDVLSTLKTVDGNNSGLDADMLDGVHNGYVSGKLHTYSIPSTGADKYNYWTKIATVKLTKQYSSQESVLLINEQYGITQNSLYAFIFIRIQQQNVMGDTPNVSLKAFGSIINENIVGILNYNSSASTFDIYYRQTYAYIFGCISYLQGSIDARTNSQELVATLPSGTQIISTNDCRCGYSDNADKLDGVQLNGIFTAFTTNGNNTRLTIGGVTKDLTVPYASNADMLDGVHNGSLTAAVLASQGNKTAISGTDVPNSGVRLYQVYNNGYPATYGNLLSIKGGGCGELLLAWKNTNRIYYRSRSDVSTEVWQGWSTVAFLSDNVASATKLQTARTIWGQSFDGTANVSGNMTNVTSISMNGTISSSYNSNTWINSLKTAIINCNITTFGGWINGKTKDGRIVIASYPNANNNLYFGYAAQSKIDAATDNTFTRQMIWAGDTGQLTVGGNILATGGGTFYSSDIRAKTIIERPKLSLNSIANSPVIKFRWNGYSDLKDDGKLHIGGIAQYIEKILPECVVGQKDDFLSFDYATTGYVFSVLTARHLLSYETRTDRIIRKLKERIKRLEKQLNIENHEEVCIVAD